MNTKSTHHPHRRPGLWLAAVTALLAALALGGCMAEQVPEEIVPTWEYIQPNILAGRGGCITCHSAAFDPLDCGTWGCGLSWASDQWARVTGTGGTTTLLASRHAGNETVNIIEPGDPSLSFLMDKLNNTQAYGVSMPLGGGLLSQGDRDLISDWITAGAPEN